MSAVTGAALAWWDAGATVLPAASDGSKRPGVPSWNVFRTTRPTREQTADLLENAEGFGILTGFPSVCMEMLELEGKAVEAGLLDELMHALTVADKDLIPKLMTYCETTPGGGIHWVYQLPREAVTGNTKLASQPREPTPENPSRVETLIETRGDGGWTVMAPSGGTTHPTGRPWRIAAGVPGTVAELTADEHETLMDACRSLDRMPPPAPMAHQPAVVAQDGLLAPGQDYEARTTWEEILGPLGWKQLYRQGEKIVWQRPGKARAHGPSATTNYDGNDNLYVFTSSTDFEPNASYTKFAAITLIEQGSITPEAFSAQAKKLRTAGYGTPLPQPSVAVPEIVDPTDLIEEFSSVPTPEPVDPGRTLLQSEDGHAALLIAQYGNVIRYCVELGKWLYWDGHTWVPQQPEGMVRECAKKVARALPEDSRDEVRFKTRCLSAIGTSGALRQAMTDMRVVVNIADLDSRPRELNTPGGVLDLPTMKLLPSDPAHLHTKVTLCAPDFNADRSMWLEFLKVTFNGDQAMIDYVQRLMGYSAIGEIGPHILPFCWGSGGNGKGVLLETVVALLNNYAGSAPANFLMAGQTKHETEIAALAGKRMVVSSEINEDDRFDEAKVKMLTGGDQLTGRFMRRDFFSFTPSHTLWLSGNAEPTVKSGGRGFWRRLRKIPFLHEVAVPIDRLKDIFVAEHGPAIMAWIAEGAAAYFKEGLIEPRVVVEATEEYRAEQDTVGRFVAERCYVGGDENVVIAVAKLREEYERWCRHEVGVEPVSAKALTQTLKRLGIGTTRNMSSRFYINIRIVPNEEDSSVDSRPWQDGLL